MPAKASSGQLIWGVCLLLAGIGVFYRIPQVMPEITNIERFRSSGTYIRFCFYMIGIILAGGGLKKIVAHLCLSRSADEKKKGTE